MIPYLKLLGWILLPPVLGLLLRSAGAPRTTARRLFQVSLFGCQTPVVLLAIWVARISQGGLYMPLLTLAGWLVTALIAWAVSRRMGHAPSQAGAFIVSMCLSNHGYTLLGLVALSVFGEAGLAQATYAQLFVIPFLVFFCFPIGMHYGTGRGTLSLRATLAKLALDSRSLPFFAMLVGFALNAGGVPRPVACGPLTRFLVYVGTGTSGMAVGVLVHGVSLRRFGREHTFSFLYRSTLYPLLFLGLAWLGGLDRVNTSIMVLYGLVPCALYASLVAEFFDLDTDLTSSMFAVSTGLFALVVLPLYLLTVV